MSMVSRVRNSCIPFCKEGGRGEIWCRFLRNMRGNCRIGDRQGRSMVERCVWMSCLRYFEGLTTFLATISHVVDNLDIGMYRMTKHQGRVGLPEHQLCPILYNALLSAVEYYEENKNLPSLVIEENSFHRCLATNLT